MEIARQWLKNNRKSNSFLFGRICSGNPQNPNEPIQKLSFTQRETIFLFGEDSLKCIGDENCTAWEFLKKLGFQDYYIYNDIMIEKTPQKLVLFLMEDPQNINFPILPASWEGVKEFLQICYPDVINDFEKFYPELTSKKYEEFETDAGFAFFSALKSKDSKEPYSYQKYLSSSRSLWEFRCFLYCELRLLELFAGDGFTTIQDAEGIQSLQEYLAKNIEIEKIKEFADVIQVHLDVQVPDEIIQRYK